MTLTGPAYLVTAVIVVVVLAAAWVTVVAVKAFRDVRVAKLRCETDTVPEVERLP